MLKKNKRDWVDKMSSSSDTNSVGTDSPNENSDTDSVYDSANSETSNTDYFDGNIATKLNSLASFFLHDKTLHPLGELFSKQASSDYLDPVQAFTLLLELRDNYNNAHKPKAQIMTQILLERFHLFVSNRSWKKIISHLQNKANIQQISSSTTKEETVTETLQMLNKAGIPFNTPAREILLGNENKLQTETPMFSSSLFFKKSDSKKQPSTSANISANHSFSKTEDDFLTHHKEMEKNIKQKLQILSDKKIAERLQKKKIIGL